MVCRLEDGLVLEPVHYFARRTLLQDSPDGRAGDNVCLRTRIQMLLEKLRPGGENNPDTVLSVCAEASPTVAKICRVPPEEGKALGS